MGDFDIGDELYDAFVRFEQSFKKIGIDPPHELVFEPEEYRKLEFIAINNRTPYMSYSVGEDFTRNLKIRGIDISLKRRE